MPTRIKKVEKVINDLGLPNDKTEETVEKLRTIIPPETYKTAIHYLGLTTIILVLGVIAIVIFEGTLPEAVWGVIGAGMGGLVGIFMGDK